MKSKSLKALVALGAATFFASNAWAVDSSRLRFLLGSGSVSEYNQTDSNGATTDWMEVSNYDVTSSGGELSFVFSNGLGIGVSSGTATASNGAALATEYAISGGGFELSYTFGEDINLTLGTKVFGDATLTTYQVNGVDQTSLYESTSKRNQSYFVNLGFAVGENWELLVGQRNFDVEVDVKQAVSGALVATYDAKFTVTSIGAGYRFK